MRNLLGDKVTYIYIGPNKIYKCTKHRLSYKGVEAEYWILVLFLKLQGKNLLCFFSERL